MKSVKYAVALAVLVLVFAAGVITGVYRTFPWTLVQPAGEMVTGLARAIGIMEPQYQPPEESEAEPVEPSRVQITTLLQDFDLEVMNEDAPIAGGGGAIALTPDLVLIARDQDGALYGYDRQNHDISPSGITLPSLNWQAVPDETDGGRSINGSWIRHNSIVYWQWQDTEHLAVSYSYYDENRQCFVMRLSRAVLPEGWTGMADVPLDWDMLMETAPCMPLHEEGRHPFAGHQAAGAMAVDAEGNLYLTVGDFEYDGSNAYRQAWPQNQDNDYGKIFRFTPEGERELVSTGHRNHQGIEVDPEGRIWAVEHAAQGGDELNLIRPGYDYGWPAVTLGIDYGDLTDEKSWWQNPVQGRHYGFEPPIYAWLPSTAPSSIVHVETIPRWQGDLLVGTLAGESLRRLRLEENRVVYDEPIHIGTRIRDIAIAGAEIFMLYDDGRFAVMQAHEMADEPATGAGVERQSNVLADFGCMECHSAATAPSLADIYGSAIAAQDGVSYSEALSSIDGIWDENTLFQFLMAPQEFAPGTSMPDPGLNAANANRLIDFMRVN